MVGRTLRSNLLSSAPMESGYACSVVLISVPVAVIKYRDKFHRGMKRFIVGSHFNIQSIMWGRSRQQDLEAAGHSAPIVKKQRVRNAYCLSVPSPFKQSRTQSRMGAKIKLLLVFFTCSTLILASF